MNAVLRAPPTDANQHERNIDATSEDPNYG